MTLTVNRHDVRRFIARIEPPDWIPCTGHCRENWGCMCLDIPGCWGLMVCQIPKPHPLRTRCMWTRQIHIQHELSQILLNTITIFLPFWAENCISHYSYRPIRLFFTIIHTIFVGFSKYQIAIEPFCHKVFNMKIWGKKLLWHWKI